MRTLIGLPNHNRAPLRTSLIWVSLPEWLEDSHSICCKGHSREQASGVQQQLLFLMSLWGSRRTGVSSPVFRQLFLCADTRLVVQEQGAASLEVWSVGELGKSSLL